MLICDKRRPRTRGDTNIRPPQGGRIKTAPPASGPRLGRSSAWGGTPPDPLGCAPWRAFAHRAPAASVIQPEGFRARVRRWRGWATACGCPCPTPSPWRFSGFGGNFKKSAALGPSWGGRGREPPCRSAVVRAGRAVGGQGAAACGCARRPRPDEPCPRATGPQGAAVEAVWLFLTLRTTYRVRSSGPRTRIKPRGERKNKEAERKL